jgi:hypothetical protein
MTGKTSILTGKFNNAPAMMTGVPSRFILRPGARRSVCTPPPPPLVDLPLVLLVYIPTSPALDGFSSLSTRVGGGGGGVEIIHRLSQLNNFLKIFVRYFLVQEWQRIQEHQECHYDSKMYNIKHVTI